jgi:rhamnogalacturonyl hydrolase YesR
MHLAKVTGNQAYLDFANQEFWQTANLLWDKEDHLFYRDTRFFTKREKNGQKIIWARGVGWVVAGLARILEQLPADHAQRLEYEDIFKKVMARLAAAQQSDGFWRPSVLAPESQPFKESSGTALIAYAYAAGVNQGLLEKQKYLPVISKAWSALVGVIQPDGKFGWVQQIGNSPESVSKDDTQIYGTGGFLLNGSEIYNLVKK